MSIYSIDILYEWLQKTEMLKNMETGFAQPLIRLDDWFFSVNIPLKYEYQFY